MGYSGAVKEGVWKQVQSPELRSIAEVSGKPVSIIKQSAAGSSRANLVSYLMAAVGSASLPTACVT